MSYDTAAAAVKALLIAMPEFKSSRQQRHAVTLGDYRVLDSDLKACAVLQPGGFRVGPANARQSVDTWDVVVELFSKYSTAAPETSAPLFSALRDAVVTRLRQYPTLNHAAGVTQVQIGSDSDPAEVYDDQKRGPWWLMQPIRVTVTIRSALTGGEYA